MLKIEGLCNLIAMYRLHREADTAWTEKLVASLSKGAWALRLVRSCDDITPSGRVNAEGARR